MKRQLLLKAGAPDEIEIGVGSDFKKQFKRSDQPFLMTDEHADMLLRSTDYFKEAPVKKAVAKKKKSARKARKTASSVKKSAVQPEVETVSEQTESSSLNPIITEAAVENAGIEADSEKTE